MDRAFIAGNGGETLRTRRRSKALELTASPSTGRSFGSGEGGCRLRLKRLLRKAHTAEGASRSRPNPACTGLFGARRGRVALASASTARVRSNTSAARFGFGRVRGGATQRRSLVCAGFGRGGRELRLRQPESHLEWVTRVPRLRLASVGRWRGGWSASAGWWPNCRASSRGAGGLRLAERTRRAREVPVASAVGRIDASAVPPPGGRHLPACRRLVRQFMCEWCGALRRPAPWRCGDVEIRCFGIGLELHPVEGAQRYGHGSRLVVGRGADHAVFEQAIPHFARVTARYAGTGAGTVHSLRMEPGALGYRGMCVGRVGLDRLGDGWAGGPRAQPVCGASARCSGL
jgi:hypothetical protein